MEKEKNSQQDLGARSHGEAVSRNESVEKLNEIPGRQIMPVSYTHLTLPTT